MVGWAKRREAPRAHVCGAKIFCRRIRVDTARSAPLRPETQMKKVDPSNDHSGDQFTVAPLLIVLVLMGVFFFSAYASNNFEQYGYLAFLSFLLALAAAAASLIQMTVRLARRRWKASISFAAPLFVLIACFLARHEVLFAIDRARFKIFRTHYVDALSPAAQLDVNGLRIVQWGFWGHFISGEFYRILAYDEADDLGHSDARIAGRTLEAMRSSIQGGNSCKVAARQVEPNFYIVDVGCP